MIPLFDLGYCKKVSMKKKRMNGWGGGQGFIGKRPVVDLGKMSHIGRELLVCGHLLAQLGGWVAFAAGNDWLGLVPTLGSGASVEMSPLNPRQLQERRVCLLPCLDD